MLTIIEYINNNQYLNLVLEEYCNIVSEDMINESFQSTLLKKLATKINVAERENNVIRKTLRENDVYYNTKNISFSTILGPIDYKANSYSKIKRVRCIKWNEISDEDFVEYNCKDKEFVKLLKNVYTKKTKAIFIVTDENDNIIYFIKGFIKPDDKEVKLITYGFINKLDKRGIYRFRKNVYKYQTRDLKVNEIINLMSETYKIYALEITQNLIDEYDTLVTDRSKNKEGVINYDKDSLEKLLKEQIARYKVLIKEIKTKKLMSDPKALFEEIKNINKEVIDFYEKVMSSSEYIDKFYDLGQLMTYTSYAYETYYKYVKNMRYSDKCIKNAINHGDLNPEEWGRYEKEKAKLNINDVKQYIEKIKNCLNEYKARL